MNKMKLEKPDAVFLYAPVIEDICIEFGIPKTHTTTITCMYEVFKRVSGGDRDMWGEEAYDEGYKDGYNAAIDDAESKADELSWEISRLKK